MNVINLLRYPPSLAKASILKRARLLAISYQKKLGKVSRVQDYVNMAAICNGQWATSQARNFFVFVLGWNYFLSKISWKEFSFGRVQGKLLQTQVRRPCERVFTVTQGTCALTLPWYENAYSPYYSPYISYGSSKENLSNYQDILSLVIVSFILITWMFEQAVIMLGEISFSSLWELKGLKWNYTQLKKRQVKSIDYWRCEPMVVWEAWKIASSLRSVHIIITQHALIYC